MLKLIFSHILYQTYPQDFLHAQAMFGLSLSYDALIFYHLIFLDDPEHYDNVKSFFFKVLPKIIIESKHLINTEQNTLPNRPLSRNLSLNGGGSPRIV
jgi:hypothetical protein